MIFLLGAWIQIQVNLLFHYITLFQRKLIAQGKQKLVSFLA
jgi:predicted ABC-type exoprotein transport system permease subunit